MAATAPTACLKTASHTQHAHSGAAEMAGGAAGGDEYSPWCPASWVDTEGSTAVGDHVPVHTVGGTDSSGWVQSSVPDLSSLADLDWMSSLTDSGSSAEEDNAVREIPSSPPLEAPQSPANDSASKFELLADLAHKPDTADTALPWIDSDMAYPWPAGQDAIATDATSISHQDDAAWQPAQTFTRAPKASRTGAFEDLKSTSSWRALPLEGAGDLGLPTSSGRTATVMSLEGLDPRPVPPVLDRTLKVGIPKLMHSKVPGSPKARKDGGSPRARATSNPKGDSISYAAMLDKMPVDPDEKNLLSVYLRDELRSLLKRNGISYHKPGRANLMKSKIEMAADLIELLAKGMKSPDEVKQEEENGTSDQSTPRGRKSAPGGSGSPRKGGSGSPKKKVVPKVSPAVPPPATKKKAAAEMDADAEFRKRIKVVLT